MSGQQDTVLGIREEAGRLLAEGRVDLVLGFERGTMPLRAAPCFVTDAADAGRLVWNAFCSNNLARYMTGRSGRAAIIAKGCDTRAIVELVRERQISRGNIVIIGVPCRGMADPRAIRRMVGSSGIASVDEAGDELVVTGSDGRISRMRRDEALHRSCRVCSTRNPVISDVLLERPVEERSEDGYDDVDRFAALPAGERRALVAFETSRCIRCNACRNACPLCYCNRCFALDNQPQWVGRGNDPGDILSFHLMRALHLAGRCVECGACERACPSGIDLSVFNRRLSADVSRMFGFRPGTDPEAASPLSAFSADDPQDFISDPPSTCGTGS